jgi:uncharacterized protein (DUF1697 family)
MPRYAALLRGVNVGGNRQLPMADFRRVLTSLGYTDVATHLNSGNAVLTSEDPDTDRIGRQIAEGLAGELGMQVGVLVRSGPELAAVVAANPFPDVAEKEPKLLHVGFASVPPDPARVAELDPKGWAPDEFGVGERLVYLRYETGSGRSKLAEGVFKQLYPGRKDVVVTTRNWNTVLALAAKTAD